MATQLHIYRGPAGDRYDENGSDEGYADPLKLPSVRVRLGDLLPLVAMAQKLNFIWLKDFLDDEVVITHDLYEVMQAFRDSRPTSA